MLTMIHSNMASLSRDTFRVDRKFHVGMSEYASKIQAPLVTVHPECIAGREAMDMVDVPCGDLPYRVMILRTDERGRLLPGESSRLRDQIARSVLVYGGSCGAAKMARDCKIPYILILEYDFMTNVKVATISTSGAAGKAARAARWAWEYAGAHIPDVRGAYRVHCNGYPVYDESRRINPDCLLYLDSRMSAGSVIPEDVLERRLTGRSGRPLRLLYSGRFEAMKGAADAVKVGVECVGRDLDVELHCYGQGSLRAEMERLVARANASRRIHIHEAVTYPELVEISGTFDLFVCCHVQNDPSCTYIESFGSGLPIVGYGNRMWRRLHGESGVGSWSPLGRPDRVAEHVRNLASDPELLATMSRRARRFALDHTFEREFGLRIDDLNTEYTALAPGRASAARP